MKKILGIILSVLFLFLFIKTPLARATNITITHDPDTVYENSGQITFTFTADQDNYFLPANDYSLGAWGPENNYWTLFNNTPYNRQFFQIINNGRSLQIKEGLVGTRTLPGEWTVKLWLGAGTQSLDSGLIASGKYTIQKNCAPNCYNFALTNSKFQAGSTVTVYLYNIEPDKDYTLWYNNKGFKASGKFSQNQIGTISVLGKSYSNGASLPMPAGTELGKYTLCLTQATAIFNRVESFVCNPSKEVEVIKDIPPTPNPSSTPEEGNQASPFPSATPEATLPPVCSDTSCSTAVGSIETNPQGFVTKLFAVLLSLAGGIALILIIISGYRLMSSGGNPEEVQHAREQLTSAIVGLLFIIFSFSILQIIGVTILHIPGLTK